MINGTYFNNNMGIAAANDPVHAYRCGLITGREGRAAGYNWTFSPVIDINFNFQNPIVNNRSYSDEPELVSKMACEYIRGVQETGMAVTCKHFPGDGGDRGLSLLAHGNRGHGGGDRGAGRAFNQERGVF